MKQKLYTLYIIIGALTGVLQAQTPRTAYHLDGYVFGHELNPAFQPEESYYSLPVLGNTSMSMQSSLGLGDLIYDRKDGELTTFMARGTISKSDLMDRVGSAFKNYMEADMTLISLGRRLSAERYQTLSVSLRGKSALRIDKSMFDLLKDVENKNYQLSDTRFDASAYAEISVGESRKFNEQWTVGAKAKLLVGLAHAEMKVDEMNVNLDRNRWTAQGQVSMQVSGFDYKTEWKDYKEDSRGQYETVTGLDIAGLAPTGLGLAVDLGATYRMDENWTFSAAVRDLGFMTWFKSKKAKNHGDPFTFDGIHNVCLKDPDDEYQTTFPDKESLKKQLNRLGDDLMDLARLEEAGSGSLSRMLGATIHAGAQYKQGQWTGGALFTTCVMGNLTWVEGRLSATYTPIEHLDISLSPAYATTGFSLGALVSYQFKNGIHLHLGSDALVPSFNRQMIPTTLCASVQMGMTFAIR